MAIIGTMDLVMELLKDIDNNHPDKGILTSIRFFSDGSGRIMQSGSGVIFDFNTPVEAVYELQSILEKYRNIKNQ